MTRIMPLLLNDQTVRQAGLHLSRHDPQLASVIAAHGDCPIRPHTDYYEQLVVSIIGQQLSVKAAASIRQRFVSFYGGNFPSPQQLLDTSPEALRTAGLSRAKIGYIRDLAAHILDGRLDFQNINELDDTAITAKLTDIKGIGEWTAHMFMMWSMGRADVLPYGDLGVRNAIMKLYGLAALPDRRTIEAIAADHHWQPYASVASWYLWQSLNNTPEPAQLTPAPTTA